MIEFMRIFNLLNQLGKFMAPVLIHSLFIHYDTRKFVLSAD